MVSPHLLNSVPAKIPRIAVYLTEELKGDLEVLANAERRSLSQMAAMLIEEGIDKAKSDGRLKLPQDRTAGQDKQA